MPKTTKPAATIDRRQRVQSAEMGMSVLKALANLGGAARLTAIASEVSESPAKVHRYLSSLCQGGLVMQHPATQHYHLGGESIRIGLAAMRQCDPVRLGEPALIRLRETLQVTCFIAVMGNLGPTVLRIEEPSLPVTINMRAGSVLPLLWSAAGRVFLAYTNDDDLLKQTNREYDVATPGQRSLLGGANAIASLRRQIRDQGCAIVQDTLLQGISAVAAPIFDSSGNISAVLTALGASTGFDARPGGKVCPMVIHEALQISLSMGYSAR